MNRTLNSITVMIVAVFMLLSCSSRDEYLIRIQENGLYGYIDTLGNVVIKPQYKYVGGFTPDNTALVISKADLNTLKDTFSIEYGYINKSNKLIVDTTNILKVSVNDMRSIWGHDNIEEFVYRFNNRSLGFCGLFFRELNMSRGLYPYMDTKTNLIGYKNISGEMVINAEYKFVTAFSGDAAFVSKGYEMDPLKSVSDNLNIYSLIAPNGDFIKEKAWAYMTPFSQNGLTWCGEVFFSDSEGSMSPMSLIWTQIDRNGKIIIGPVRGDVGSFIYNGYSGDKLYLYQFPDYFGFGSGYSYLDENGKFATDWNEDNEINMFGENKEVYCDATPFSEGYAGIKFFAEDIPVWAFVDKNFDLVTDIVFDSVKVFHDGLAVVQELNLGTRFMGNWGAVNDDFDLVIPYKFSKIEGFNKGFSYASIYGLKYDREGIINKKGEFIWETKRQKKE